MREGKHQNGKLDRIIGTIMAMLHNSPFGKAEEPVKTKIKVVSSEVRSMIQHTLACQQKAA